MMNKTMTKKILAIFMLISILMTDFYVLGSSLISYAADGLDVEISAYFKDEDGNKIYQISKNINDENVKLYADITVNQGYLTNGKISIENGNFKIKGSNEVNLNQITAGETVTADFDIEPIISDIITVDMLTKKSTVKLIGNYTNTNSKSELETETIEVTDDVTVNYKPDEMAKAELETKIITNNLFQIGENKERIVQLLIKSKFTDNQYPVEQTTLNVTIPQLSEEKTSVEILAIGKLATNGDTEISQQDYTINGDILQIILKNEKNTAGEINWGKNAYDEIIVTVRYDENVDVSLFNFETNSEIKLYNFEESYTGNCASAIENEENNNIIMSKAEIVTEELYKGKLYANIDTEYETKASLIITNVDVAEEIILNEGPDVFVADVDLEANTKYIKSVVNLQNVLTLFGTDGNIVINNGNTATLINKETQVDENGNVVIYHEDGASELEIITSNPKSVGILEIEHTKLITGNNYTKNQLKTIHTLKTVNSVIGTITIDKEKQKVVENSTEAIVELKETISKAELTIENNKETLATTEANDLTLGVTLVTDETKYDLYKNPQIAIQFPAAVENVELNEAITKQNAEEFTIEDEHYDSKTKTYRITLKGEQTTYSESSLTQAYIQLNFKVTLSQLATNQEDKIIMTYTNENASSYEGNTTDVGTREKTVKISAPTGLIKTFNLNINENIELTEDIIQKIEEQNAGKTINFETILVNNIGTDINNVRILGKLPTIGNTITGKGETNTFETILKSINAQDAEIYYTENVEATVDVNDTANGWTTNLAELTNAKLYLVKLNTLSNATQYEINVNVQIPSTINPNETSYTEYTVIYDTDSQTNIEEKSRKIGLTTDIVAGLEAELKAEVGQSVLNTGDIVKAGEVIKYTVTVRNEGNKLLENIQIKAPVPVGTILVQPKADFVYADGYYDEKDNTEMTATLNLEAGAEHTLKYEVRVKTDITTGDEISNKVIITYNNSEIESNEIKNSLEEGNLRVSLKRLNDESIEIIPGYVAKYTVYIENISGKKMTNINVKFIENTLTIQSVNCLEDENIFMEANEITEIKIGEIPANEKRTLEFFAEISEDARSLELSVNAVDSEQKVYRSNAIYEKFDYIDATISLTSPQKDSYIKNGDYVEYNITVKNTGEIAAPIIMKYFVERYFVVESISLNGNIIKQITDQTNAETYSEIISNEIDQMVELEPGQEANYKVITKVKYFLTKEEGTTKEIFNQAEVAYFDIVKNKSEEIKHILIAEEETTGDLKNIVSGTIWVDKNDNGIYDSNEVTLNGITVKMYDNVAKKYLTDEEGNEIKVTTSNDGKYQFTKIKDGEYIIVYEYDTEKYEPTANSKVRTQKISINEVLIDVTGTEIININDNIAYLDIALKDKTNNEVTPGDPNEAPKENYSISGLAWLDTNRDGDKDGGEITLSGIKVKLYSVLNANYLTDNNGNIIETTTNNNGEYKFDNVEKGEYIVLFEYDKEKYEPTIYLAQYVDEINNSNAILKTLTINGQELTLAVTDKINVQNNVSNINIGLKEKLIFDLELNKYISKIVVQNSKNTKSYEYDNKTFGKVEIHRKQINGSLVVLEYTIKVKNTGEIAGYAKNIVDYLSSGLTFSSELNKDWYLSGNHLYTKGLENIEINPGEEKEIKLILTKTMTNESAGLINNRAEIYQDYNKYGEIDIDSTPNNQVKDEDDMGYVDVIIGTSTGGSNIINIILVIINLVLIAIAVKLMIKNGIIKISTKKGGQKYE